MFQHLQFFYRQISVVENYSRIKASLNASTPKISKGVLPQCQNRLGLHLLDGFVRCLQPQDQKQWQISVFLGIIQHVGEVVIQFFAGFNDTNAHNDLAIRQLISSSDDLINGAEQAKTSPGTNQSGGKWEYCCVDGWWHEVGRFINYLHAPLIPIFTVSRSNRSGLKSVIPKHSDSHSALSA